MASTDDGTSAVPSAPGVPVAHEAAVAPEPSIAPGADYQVAGPADVPAGQPSAPSAAGPQAGGGTPPPEPPAPGDATESGEGPKPETLIDAVADLMQMVVNYMRQETAGVMRDKVVLPGQQLGMLVAFALAAAALLFLGIGFIAVAVLLVLAHYLGWPGALALIGVLLLIGAGVFTYLKVRSIQT